MYDYHQRAEIIIERFGLSSLDIHPKLKFLGEEICLRKNKPDKATLSFHSQSTIKDMFLTLIKEHRLANKRNTPNIAFEIDFGIPYQFIDLENTIFCKLSNKQKIKYPLNLLNKIPIGIDLNVIWKKTMVWLLIDKEWGRIQYEKNEEYREWISDFAKLYEMYITQDVPQKMWDWMGIPNLDAPVAEISKMINLVESKTKKKRQFYNNLSKFVINLLKKPKN